MARRMSLEGAKVVRRNRTHLPRHQRGLTQEYLRRPTHGRTLPAHASTDEREKAIRSTGLAFLEKIDDCFPTSATGSRPDKDYELVLENMASAHYNVRRSPRPTGCSVRFTRHGPSVRNAADAIVDLTHPTWHPGGRGLSSGFWPGSARPGRPS